MKAQDLMVGDWIIVDNEAMQVMPTLIEALFYDNPIKVEPIEITTEILEANGFENYKNIGSIRYFRKDGVKYEVHQGLLYFGRGEIQGIEYVHEMQHALRLIEHADLADNFKIEKGGNQ
ncbi:MAG: hypothetical protein IJQ83_07485 [Bacteroidales bacterium]|nr:hypothetical protein [Bacteroidales bacterium]